MSSPPKLKAKVGVLRAMAEIWVSPDNRPCDQNSRSVFLIQFTISKYSPIRLLLMRMGESALCSQLHSLRESHDG